MTKSTVLILINLFVVSSIYNAQDSIGPGGSFGDGAPRFSPQELAAAMNDLKPGSGDQFLNDYNNGGFHLGELAGPGGVDGAADADTILIDSMYNDGDPKNSLEECADTAIHEHGHWENSQGSPNGQDPTTSDPLCGGCNHASMHMEQLQSYVELACDENSVIDFCNLAEKNLYAAGEAMLSCSPDCSSFSGTDDSLTDLEAAYELCCE